MEKKYTKEQVIGFNESDWEWRRSSGYAGYDNVNHHNNESEWIYEKDYGDRQSLKKQYEEDYKFASELLDGCIKPKENIPLLITEFLDKKYFI